MVFQMRKCLGYVVSALSLTLNLNILRFLGGGSSINFQMYTRASASDWGENFM